MMLQKPKDLSPFFNGQGYTHSVDSSSDGVEYTKTYRMGQFQPPFDVAMSYFNNTNQHPNTSNINTENGEGFSNTMIPPSLYYLSLSSITKSPSPSSNNTTPVSDIYDPVYEPRVNNISNSPNVENVKTNDNGMKFKKENVDETNDLTRKILTAMENDMNNSHSHSSIYTPDENIKITDSKNDFPLNDSNSTKSKLSRKEFRETIGRQIYDDILSDIYSYEEIIEKYKTLYPQYSSKFTKNFCSKIRCGRIMNSTTKLSKRRVCDGDPKMKRIKKRSPKNTWQKMTDDLYKKISDYEKDHPNIKQSDLQKLFNVNRSTYWRWKKKLNQI